MISRSTLVGALVVVELAILGAAGQAIAGGHQHYHDTHRHFGLMHDHGTGNSDEPVVTTVDKTFAAGAAPHIVVDVDNANVFVQAGSGMEVRVAGTMRVSGTTSGSKPSLTAVRTADGVRVSVESGLVHVRRGRLEREIRLTVPTGAEVEIASAGAVESTGLHGKLVVRVNDGSVRIVNQRGDVDVTTGSGDVELLDVQSASIAAHTHDGALKLTSSGADRIDARTGSGAITAVGLRAVDGAVATDDGHVDVTFAANSDANVVLHTDDGSITGAGPGDTSQSAESRTLRLGDSRGNFAVSTSSGSITVSQGDKV